MTWKPGTEASASSIAALLTARPTTVFVRVADDEPEQRGCLLLDGRVGVVGAGEGPADLGWAALCGAQARLHLGSDQGGLGVDVEAGEDEDDLVAVAAQPGETDLQRGGGASPRTPSMRTRSVSVLVEADGVEAGGDVGTEVAGARGLVQQLRGDGADGHGAAGAGVLGDDGAAVGVQFGDGEAGVAHVEAVAGEERVVAAGGLGAALQDVAGDDSPGKRDPGRRAPSRSGRLPRR